MEKENRLHLSKIILSAALLITAVIIEKNTTLITWQLFLIFLVPYLIVGYGVLVKSARNIIRGEIFDENFLMSLATLGAMCIGFMPGAEHQFPEAVFVMLFYQVGELFEDIAEDRSRKSISELMDIRPDYAHVVREGKELTIDPNEVKVGEIIVVKPGEKIPIDGIVLEGRASLDTVALTGESMPRSVEVNDEVVSGCLNLNGLLTVKVTKAFGESTASKVLELVENASENKSRSENFITRFARVYTPIVVGLAVALAVLPPLFSGNWATWIYRALIFLVVSCPCALVISVPLTFFAGIGGASRKGILVKGSNYLEALACVEIAVFDKTGTLTHGVFDVTAVHPENIEKKELLHLAAHVERNSNHPIALSLKNAYPQATDNCCTTAQVQEMAGQGMMAVVNGKTVGVGNERMMQSLGASIPECRSCPGAQQGTTIHMTIDGEYAGHIIISDRIKQDAQEAISLLKSMGVKKTVMLTGDRQSVAQRVAQEVGIDEFHAQLLPAHKVEAVEKLMREKVKGRTLAFVGDGINDAPVLARADVGIAMGALGSDAAIEAADVVLMDDKPSKIATAIKAGKKTLGIARENVYFSIGVKVAVLLLAALGLAGMWLASLADVGVMVLAVLNATRALNP